MKVIQTNFFGDNNLGLFGKASDEYCFIGNVMKKEIKKIEKSLKVKAVKITIANTDLVGIFCAFNSNGIVVPRIINESELKKFKKVGLNVKVIKSKYTALGNLILCNDKGALISKLFSKREKKDIEDVLGVETEFGTVANIKTVGSCGIATNKGCLVHRDVKEEEIGKIEDVLKVDVDIGTLNFGSPFVGACGIANSKGAVVGETSTGPEIHRLMEALSFL